MGKYKVTTEKGVYIVTTEEPAKDSYWGDVKKGAIQELKDMAVGIPQLASDLLNVGNTPMNAVAYPVERAMGIPSAETKFMRGVQTAQSIPGMLVDSVADTAKTVASPNESFRNRPISTVLTGASIAVPMIKGAMALKTGQAATSAASSPGIVKRAFAKTSPVAFGTPEEAVLTRMQNPQAIKTAFNHTELADQMVTSVKNLQETLSEASEKAGQYLRSSPYLEDGAIPKTKVLDVVKAARRGIGGAWTPDSKAAVSSLKKTYETFRTKLKSTVSESQVKDLIRDLDGNINWGNPAASKTNNALIGIRTRLDKMLKNQNPEYKTAMVDVDENMRVYNKMQKSFGINYETAKGFEATDQTVNKLKRALKEEKVQTQSLLDRFQKLTGEDWKTKIKNANAKEAFDKEGRSWGSSRSVMGLAAGEMAGNFLNLPPVVGGAIGSVIGGFQNVYGPQIAGRIADVLANPAMSRYASVLEKAAAKGVQNAVATHALLMERDPVYAKAMASVSSVGK